MLKKPRDLEFSGIIFAPPFDEISKLDLEADNNVISIGFPVARFSVGCGILYGKCIRNDEKFIP